MIKIKLLIIIIFCVGFIFGQEQRITLNEIRLVEKKNHIISNLPELLLEAYCKGELPGYYPNYIKAQVSFTEFLNYAYLEDPSYNNGNLNCPSEFCKLDKEELLMFKQKLEFVEIEKRAHVGQEPSKMIYYLRLKFLHNDKYYNGPVFFTKDILALGDSYKLYNPKNDAASYSLKKIFLSRVFSSRTIKDFTNDKFDSNKSKQNNEYDLYEY